MKWRKNCSSCPSNKCWVNVFRSNVSSKFLYFVGNVFDENTGNISTRVNGWKYLRWMSIWECNNYLLQFFTWRCQNYSFSVELALSCVHKYWNLVLCLSVQVLENIQLCVPPFHLCLTYFSLTYEKFISYWLKPWKGVVSDNLPQGRGACLSSTASKMSQNWSAFPTYENSETMESPTINDGRSMLAMLPTVLYGVDGLDTKSLK